MLQIGDIILIEKFKNLDREEISKHYFIILNNENGDFYGKEYDFSGCEMPSLNEKNYDKKIFYESNYEVKKEFLEESINNKNGYIILNQQFLFKEEKIEYKKITKMKSEELNKFKIYFANWVMKNGGPKAIEYCITNL